MKKKILYQIIFILSLFSSHLSAEHATLIDLGFDCETNSGFAEFELDGSPNQYEYYWSNGATTLRIENVPKGVYTFTVIDLLGCKEEIEVNIFPDVDYVCVADYALRYDPKNCKVQIDLSFNDDDVTVVWADGYQGGMTRVVDLGPNDVEYCATITSNLDGCCFSEVCALVKGDPKACPGEENNDEDPSDINEVSVYPNPYQIAFNVDLKSKISGEAKLSVQSSNGKTESTFTLKVSSKFISTYEIKGNPIPGAKILIVEFPSGEKISTKLIQIK